MEMTTNKYLKEMTYNVIDAAREIHNLLALVY